MAIAPQVEAPGTTIGKGGLVAGGAHGSGRVYEKGAHVGDVSMTQVTVVLQLGGQAFSEIIFFENKAAFDAFTAGNFEFSGQASAEEVDAATTGGGTEAWSPTGSSPARRRRDWLVRLVGELDELAFRAREPVHVGR